MAEKRDNGMDIVDVGTGLVVGGGLAAGGALIDGSRLTKKELVAEVKEAEAAAQKTLSEARSKVTLTSRESSLLTEKSETYKSQKPAAKAKGLGTINGTVIEDLKEAVGKDAKISKPVDRLIEKLKPVADAEKIHTAAAEKFAHTKSIAGKWDHLKVTERVAEVVKRRPLVYAFAALPLLVLGAAFTSNKLRSDDPALGNDGQGR